MVKQLTLPALLESFFRERLVGQCNASSATVQSYRDALRLLLMFAANKLRRDPDRLVLGDLDRKMILRFLDYLENERGNSVTSRNTRLVAIRSFFLHVAYCDPASVALAKSVLDIQVKRSTRQALRYLNKSQVKTFMATPDRATEEGRRHYTLLSFLLMTGARVSEAIAVKFSDIRFEHPAHTLLHGKGSKDRLVPLSKDLEECLRHLCQERGLSMQSNEPVFLNRRGERISRFGVGYIIRRYAFLASDRDPSLTRVRVTPHLMRHTAAMRLLQAGVDLATIQAWLGHASITTTHGYVEADLAMKREALKCCGSTPRSRRRYPPTPKILHLLENLDTHRP